MSDSTSLLDPVIAGANAATRVNELFDAASPATMYGRRASTTSGLTWGYYGGRTASTLVPNGTVTLTASATNHVVALKSTGAVSVSVAATNWGNPALYQRLYKIVAGTVTVSSYEDHRSVIGGVLSVVAGTGVTVDNTNPANPIVSASGGGGGLTRFTETLSTASPNGTVNAAALSVTGGTANVDAVISPKGTGAFLLEIPNGLTSGGNKRGTYSVDLQLERGAETQVANGDRAAAIGSRNTASGQQSIAIGNSNVVSGPRGYALGDSNSITAGEGSVALGIGNSTSADQQVALGAFNTLSSGTGAAAVGEGNTVTGTQALALGSNHTASGAQSSALGTYASTRGSIGRIAMSSGRRLAVGDTQASVMTLARSTTGATPMVLTSNAAAPVAENQLGIPAGAGFSIRGRVIAREASTDATKMWSFTAFLKNTAADAVSLMSAVSPVTDAADAGAAAWTIAVTADNTNKCLAVEATGEASKTIGWSCVLESAEVVA